MKTLIIIPAYNEAGNIEKVVDNLIKEYSCYDYIIINDASTDETIEICKKKKYNYLDNPINLGIGGAVQNGYQYAFEKGYDVAVQIDGDGQHDIKYVRDMIKKIEAGNADIVIGSRFIEKKGFQSSLMRRMGILMLSVLIRLCTGEQIKDVTSGFRAVNKRFIEIYAKDYPSDYPEPEAIVAAIMHQGQVLEIPVIMKERIFGKSSINFWKSIYYMIKVVLAVIICRISFGVRRG